MEKEKKKHHLNLALTAYGSKSFNPRHTISQVTTVTPIKEWVGFVEKNDDYCGSLQEVPDKDHQELALRQSRPQVSTI